MMLHRWCTKLQHSLQLSTARPPAEACSCRRIKHQLGSTLQVGEVGELAELFQWRPDSACRVGLPGFSEAERQSVGEEMSDVCTGHHSSRSYELSTFSPSSSVRATQANFIGVDSRRVLCNMQVSSRKTVAIPDSCSRQTAVTQV